MSQSGEMLEVAVEAALAQLIEAIYQRSDALARNAPPAEFARLDAGVSKTEEAWKRAKQSLALQRQMNRSQVAR
jgi:hypothetical protein